ncbi:FRG domain-containing protein [Burkholderia lata]|uniref:FRG domain-containing protein n=1 Tax=Burkholderia lata (strain ATCC 17760 / DSM 23089 / LMG 22485 / NCIMB 9086 / R18194 / 383) TaxID=482957 RepID=UPI001453B38E|nr:FRG domain-containing protein [Burkholderia lata]VWB34341.1 FRG domain-containing protein [Burkholderia lata]
MPEYLTFHHDSLDEFWNAVSPIGSMFGSPLGYSVFRGQRNSEWELVPQVYRRDVIDKYKTGLVAALADHPGQTLFEWGLLDSFIHHCDLRGLSIPSDSMEFREYFRFQNIMAMNSANNRLWPQDRVLALMAMAQHHGVPTRLLDWSINPMVACYFAASGAINENEPRKEDRIAVFGFTFDYWKDRSEYRPVKVPGSTSVNISAQGGMFMLVNNSGSIGENFTAGVKLEDKLSGNDRLIKLTLPKSLASELLNRCHKFGVSAASIFPGYDGVAKAVLERTLAASFVERLV